MVLPEEAASMSLKDKPVGGVKTGPTRCGSLGLAHKSIINFMFLQKPKRLGLCTYFELKESSKLSIVYQCMRYPSAIAWGNVRPQAKGVPTHKRLPPLSTITGEGEW